jgi:hypothetical protein
MLLKRGFERSRAGPEATFAALWSEAPCSLYEALGKPAGDRRMVTRLFRKLHGYQMQRQLSRPRLEEET